MKYFIFSIDDGTIYDEKVIAILNRHGIKGTFNLNSGLDDFVWYDEGRPVCRLPLPQCVELYKGHEVASHSLTHPHMTMLDDDRIGYEAGVDKENLERIFGYPISTFAFPFEDFDERSIHRVAIIGFTAVRVSEIDASFRFPVDPYHIKITSLDLRDAVEKFPAFLEDPEAELFTFVSHGYDFEFGQTYELLDSFCAKVKESGVTSIHTRDLPKIMGF